MMICLQCDEQGITPARIYELGSTATLLGWRGPFHDELGRHVHDPNVVTTELQCSNDHEWTTRSKQPCPNTDCGWPS